MEAKWKPLGLTVVALLPDQFGMGPGLVLVCFGGSRNSLPNPRSSVAEPERLRGFHRLSDAGAHLVCVHHRRKRDFRVKAHKERLRRGRYLT